MALPGSIIFIDDPGIYRRFYLVVINKSFFLTVIQLEEPGTLIYAAIEIVC